MQQPVRNILGAFAVLCAATILSFGVSRLVLNTDVRPIAVEMHGLVAASTGDVGIETGRHDAPVRVVVFGDYNCPACAAFQAEVGYMLKAWADAGRVHLTYVPIVPDTLDTTYFGTLLVQCARMSGDPWPLHEAVSQWGRQGIRDGDESSLASLAAEVGFDADQLARCATTPESRQSLVDAGIAAMRLGVTRYPTLFVDEVKVTAQRSFQEYVHYLSAVLDEAATKRTTTHNVDDVG